MATARDIIKYALLKLGAITKSEAPDADEATDALYALNSMLSSWSNEGILANARVIETFPLVGGTGSYTIGTGGTFNTIRPIQIIHAFIKSANVTYNLEQSDDEQFDSIIYPPSTGIPAVFNYDNAYPLGKIKLYPIPSAAYTLSIMSEKAISSFATLDTVVSLPDGWERALIYNLALELSPEYQQITDQFIIKAANEAKGALKLAVTKLRGMDRKKSNSPYFNGNIYAGWWG